MNRWLVGIISVALIGLVIGLVVFSRDDDASDVTKTMDTPISEDTNLTSEQSGELVSYSEENLAQSDAQTNLIFFHAAWCTVCNSVQRSIDAGTIPEGMRIFKVDYDSDIGQALAEKYKIPIQYTMVQVDTAGNEIHKWVNNFNDGVSEFQQNIKQT